MSGEQKKENYQVTKSEYDLLKEIKDLGTWDDIKNMQCIFNEMFTIAVRSELSDDTEFRNKLTTVYENASGYYEALVKFNKIN